MIKKGKQRVIVTLSKEAYDKLLELRHKCIASKDQGYLYTASEVIEYCILFGPMKVSKNYDQQKQ